MQAISYLDEDSSEPRPFMIPMQYSAEDCEGDRAISRRVYPQSRRYQKCAVNTVSKERQESTLNRRKLVGTGVSQTKGLLPTTVNYSKNSQLLQVLTKQAFDRTKKLGIEREDKESKVGLNRLWISEQKGKCFPFQEQCNRYDCYQLREKLQ